MSGIIGVSPNMRSGIVDVNPYSIISYSGYVVYKFTDIGSQIFFNPAGRHYMILLVAGGGSGGSMGHNGSHGGAGGGAGGVVFYNNFWLDKGNYRLNVGQGGYGGVYNVGNMGGKTTFESLNTDAIGGGEGGGNYTYVNQPGGHGGSGGGGGNDTGSAGTTLDGNQGHNGGGSTYGTNGYAGGGGGGSETGQSSGLGGDGIAEGTSVFDHSQMRRTVTIPSNFQDGSSTFTYGGGGSSGRWTSNGQLTGGAGGGGAGGAQANHGGDGTDGLGGGGGGGSAQVGFTSAKGGSGGNGLILMRYAT